MAFDDSFLDELKSRVRLADVVGRRVKLVRKGREHTGLCPFHSEKSPSFFVNEAKGFYHCFGCGAHGDAIKFVTETEGLNFREAVERLAGEAGLQLPAESPREREAAQKRRTLVDVVAMAQAHFREALASPSGASARAYLERRGLSPEAQARFGLGWAPDARQGLIRHLKGKGVPVAEILEAGLAAIREGDEEPIDFFRGRLTIPINDTKGRPVAFGARTLNPDVKPKYINTGETPLFHKGRQLYNLDKARKPAFDAQSILVAEGYLDVIALSEAGFENAVAPLGTALTEDQLALLWRLAPEPVLCFDGDAAGKRAAYRALDRALPHLKPGQSLRFAFLPDGLDPDDLIRRDGRSAMAAVIDDARPLVEVFWEREHAAADLSTPERRAGLQRRLDEAVAQIADPTVRDLYKREMKDRAWKLFNPERVSHRRAAPVSIAPRAPQPPRSLRPQPRVGRFQRPQSPAFGNPPTLTASAASLAARRQGGPSRASSLEDLCVAILVRHPGIALRDYEAVEAIEFESPLYARLKGSMLHFAVENEVLDPEALEIHLESEGYGDFLASMAKTGSLVGFAQLKPDAPPADVQALWRETLGDLARRRALAEELRRARNDFAHDPSEMNVRRLSEIERAMAPEADDAGFAP